MIWAHAGARELKELRTPSAARQRVGKKRQAFVHAVIDCGMIVWKLLVSMRNAKLVQPPHEPTGAVKQVELILLTAVDVKCLNSPW